MWPFDLRPHPTKPHTFLDEHGEEWILRVTTGPSCAGVLTDDGDMNEAVFDSNGEIVDERSTPFADWNRI